MESSMLAGFSMPGNEVSDKLHNFFEQDNSAQSHQSHIGDGIWPILNNNPWVGMQRQKRMPLNSNSDNSSVQSLDPDRENSRQSSQVPFSTNLNQFALNPGFDKSHPRNQHLALNGFMHGLEGLQTMSKQAEFRDDGMVSDRHNLSTFESHHGNASEYSSCHIKNPERPEVAKAPDNFDFLGNQQQLMKSQLLGMSPHPRQHQGFNDTQVGQQNPMHKQLHELQRQQQFWQLDLGARQHNSHSRLSVAAKQAGIEQSPALLNGVPINSASNHTLPNNFMGGQLKTPSNSQMFLAGNMNWAQYAGSPLMHDYSNGLMFPNEQGQTMQSMGFVPPQLDSSLHGTPVSSTSVSSNQHSHFQVLSPDCTDVMTKPSGNQVEKISVQSAPFNPFQSDLCIRQQGFLQDCISVDTQGYQGKSLLGNASVQNQSNDVMSGNLHQMNHLQQNLQLQEVQGRPGQADWSSNLQETEAAHVGPSHGVASLDPTEEKLLFGTGDGDTWDASFGSWSALVEDAVRGSSHDKEFHEQWNCSNFKKTEPSTGNHSAVLYDNEKQQATWDSDNLQAASLLTSKSIPLPNDGDSNPNCHITSGFQHSSTKSAYEQNDIGLTDASHDSFKQSLKEAKTKLFDQSEKQKQFGESGLQAQMPENVVTNGVLAGNTYEPSRNIVHSSDAELKARNIHGVWAHQQNSMTNVSSQRIISPNGWNANKSIVPSGDNNLKFHDNNNTNQSAQRTDTKGIIHLENNYNGSMWNVGGNCVNFSAMEPESESGNLEMRTEDAHMGNFRSVINSNTSKLRQEMNQGIVNRHLVDFGKHAAFGSHVISNEDENVGKYQHQPRMGPQAWDSSLNSGDKGSGDTSDNKQEHPKVSSNEDHTSNHLHLGQHTDNGDVERENSLLTGSEPSPLITVNVMASGQAGRQTSAPQKFQYHPTGNLGMNMEPTDSPSHTSYFQGLPRPVIGGFEDQEQGYIRQLQSAGRVISDNDMVMGKRNIKEAEELQSRGSAPSHNTTASASFGGSTAQFPQNNSSGLMSQNMLKLLHKVDRSRNSNRGALFGFSDHKMPSGGTEVSASDGSASPPQRNQSSSLQGFGLHLAPPSQRQLVPNYVFPSQTSNGFDTKQVKPEAGDKDQTRSTCTVSVHSLSTAHEASERERCDNKSTGQTCKDISHSIAQNSPLAVAASDFSYERNQLPQQQHNKSIAPGHEIMDQSVNISSGGQAEINAYVKQASLLGQSYDSHDRAAADKSVQTSLPTVSGRIPPFRLPSSADNGAPVSQFYSAVSGHSQLMDVGFNHLRGSGEQLPVMNSRTVPQPSVTSGMSRQAVFSTMLHNISAQQRLSGVLPQKFTPNMPQSMIPSTSGTGTNSWALQKIDNHCTKGGSASSEFPTCSTSPHCFSGGEDDPVKDNSLQKTYSEGADVTPKRSATSLDQASVPKLLTGGNSSVSIPSLVCLHQQNVSKGKHGHDPFPDSRTEDVPLPHVVSSSSGMALYGPTLKPSEAQRQNFSLLQQMQAMKDADSDPSRRVEKRLKGADLGSEASQMSWKAGQRFIYGQNTVFRFPPDCERATTLHNSFRPDGKMLSFSSRENEDISASTSSQLADGEACSQDIHTSRQHHLQNHIHSLSTKSALNFMGGSQGPQIKPQMAPSWFEQFGTYKSQIPDMCDHQRSAKVATQQYIFPKVSESMDNTIVIDQGTDTDLAGNLRRSTPSNTMGADESSSPHLPSDITDRDMVLRPKKRKSSTSELLPWHKEVAEISQRPQSISMAELDWSQATNRLIEKVEVEAEMIDDGLSMPQSQRRLILTTQLMQQLLPSVPAAILAEGATSAYESVTYFVAKAALGDACSLMSYSRSDSHLHCDSEDMICEKLKTSEKAGDHICSEVVEDFFARSRKMEIDLSRLEKRASLLDIKMECQGLERFSIINRLGKFHGRSHTDGVASSSTSGAAPCRTFPQRYVTALSMPGNLPVGVYCLSL